MLRLSIASIAFALAMPAAHATNAPERVPALKADVIVASDIVRIGDLVEHAGAVADIPIFRSPDLGQTGMVQTSRVLDALRPHRLSEVDTQGLAEVAVTRISRTIGPKEIEERIAAALAGQQGLGEARQLALTFDREARSIYVEPSAGELKVTRASFDAHTGRFDAMLDVPDSLAARRMRLRYSGRVLETVEIAVLARPVNRGELLKASDVIIERRPKAMVVAGSLEKVEQVAGLAARGSIRAGNPMRAADLMKPEIVRQNENVTITYEVPGILLSVRGKALDSGAEGDIVNVLNVQSKRTVQGTVSGPGRVSLVGAAPRTLTADIETTASIAARAPQQRTE